MSETSASARMMELTTGALLSQAVSVTAALGVADELASGPRPVEEVAAAGRSLFEYLGHHPDAAGLFDGAMADLSRGWVAAVEDDGRVPLAEALLPDGVAPSPAKVMDLAMLAVTPGGRQRTEAEHRELLRRAGPRLSRVVPGDVYSLEEAVPAEPERRAP